ncbi:hypothetical protein JCM3766R1_000859 [Sporobolomyces carnicolor]
MPMFNTSNPFRSSSSASKSSSSTPTSARRGPRAAQPSSARQQTPRPPPDPRLVSLAQLDSATARLADLRKAFVVPRHLTFKPNSSKLDYTPNNAPFHSFDEALTKLLIELDSIDSCGGDLEIRTRRKGLVLEVEREIEQLEAIRKREYERSIGRPRTDAEPATGAKYGDQSRDPAARRPSDHSEPQPNRLPPAYRRAGREESQPSTAWNGNNQRLFGKS